MVTVRLMLRAVLVAAAFFVLTGLSGLAWWHEPRDRAAALLRKLPLWKVFAPFLGLHGWALAWALARHNGAIGLALLAAAALGASPRGATLRALGSGAALGLVSLVALGNALLGGELLGLIAAWAGRALYLRLWLPLLVHGLLEATALFGIPFAVAVQGLLGHRVRGRQVVALGGLLGACVVAAASLETFVTPAVMRALVGPVPVLLPLRLHPR